MYKILIVDDEAGIRKLVETTMRFTNYHFLQAKNGEDAVELALREKPDIILMDVNMPGSFDGLEATRRIRLDPSMNETKIIILTSNNFDSDKQRAKDCGADDYFVKPFRPLELMKKVEAYLPEDGVL